MNQINRCPSTLAEGFTSYSPTALKKLFAGRSVSHVLPFPSPASSEAMLNQFLANRQRISVSGVQEKLSLRLDGNQLRLAEAGEQGQYLLKPVPRDLKQVADVPANEHLTMQIAKQVFGLETAENALIFFEDSQPAYLTRRFDVDSNGNKKSQEDFASLAMRTEATNGPNYKYDGSYEYVGTLVKKYVGAYPVALDELYRIVIFNYLFSNGDAHLKNFSLLETSDGDYLLSPLYDLICTRLHVEDSYFALTDGLFEHEYTTESYRANGFPAYDDFYDFGIKLNIPKKRIEKTLQMGRQSKGAVHRLIDTSFLSPRAKELYREQYQQRLKALQYSFRDAHS